MTVAQLVHPAQDLVWQQFAGVFHIPSAGTARRRSPDAALWRAMATGFGFALVGLVMMALAIGAAGVAPAAADAQAGAPAIAQTLPGQHLEAYEAHPRTLIGEMPVP